ncbi:MAG: pantoate--beta-alanine ligase [Acidimicrobiia bacterium]
MRVARTFGEARTTADGRVALIPTMGALHEGHLALVDTARAADPDTVMMSVFVNPIQFDDPADLERYPRDLERDTALAEAAGVGVLFAPSVEEMYPQEPVVRVSAGPLGEPMEGRRKGHFDGVATVVTKLFAGLQPSAAVFGRKDAQQVAVIRRLVVDLSFPVRVLPAPTLREPDGLALSSRNVFLDDREGALGLSRGLFAAADAIEGGLEDGSAAEAIVAEAVADAGAQLHYASLVDAATLEPVDRVRDGTVLAVAAQVGEVRLIDNVHIDGDGTVDRGRLLTRPSTLTGGG